MTPKIIMKLFLCNYCPSGLNVTCLSKLNAEPTCSKCQPTRGLINLPILLLAWDFGKCSEPGRVAGLLCLAERDTDGTGLMQMSVLNVGTEFGKLFN